ncbi:hypothetical protein [Desulfuromonas soudanensis]|uniref:hypothetical protein n=1 Tax=Desulfuromonas soudanensis TaxID=1603606 RepID=UPI0018DFA0F5|nr:hypothetical protein [Desulfuromonas soudanensis]
MTPATGAVVLAGWVLAEFHRVRSEIQAPPSMLYSTLEALFRLVAMEIEPETVAPLVGAVRATAEPLVSAHESGASAMKAPVQRAFCAVAVSVSEVPGSANREPMVDM